MPFIFQQNSSITWPLFFVICFVLGLGLWQATCKKWRKNILFFIFTIFNDHRALWTWLHTCLLFYLIESILFNGISWIIIIHSKNIQKDTFFTTISRPSEKYSQHKIKKRTAECWRKNMYHHWSCAKESETEQQQ